MIGLRSVAAPARVAVGSARVRVPFVVETDPAGVRVDSVDVTLVGGDDAHPQTPIAEGVVDASTPGQTVFTGALVASATDVIPASYRVDAETGHGVRSDGEGWTCTRLGWRSLLAERASRSGDVVHVFGAARVYSPAGDDYVPRVGQRVELQRWSSRGWIGVRELATDRSGHVDATVRIPWRVAVRLVAPDTAHTFGAVTSGSVV